MRRSRADPLDQRARTKRSFGLLLLGLSAACAARGSIDRPSEQEAAPPPDATAAPTAPDAGVSEAAAVPDAGEASGASESDSDAVQGPPLPLLTTSSLNYQSGGAGPPAGESQEPEPFTVASVPIRGWLSTSLRARATNDASDVDLFASLALDIADPAQDAVTAHVLAYGNGDLDGRPSDAADDATFFDINDTYESSVVGRLYDAYIDVHAVEALDVARLGRQIDYETLVPAWFDGVRVASDEWTEGRAQLGGFVGAPVRIFESSDGVTGGAFAQARPWEDGRLRVDYMHLEEEQGDDLRKDDLYGIRGWQSVGGQLSLAAGYTHLESDPRDWNARADWYDAKSDLRLSAGFYELLRTQTDFALEIDPFYATLFELVPYRQGRFLASKGLGEHLRVEAGADVRRVSDQDEVAENNRDFDRYHLTTSFLDLPAELDLGLTGELYDASGSDIGAWGADLARRFGERWDGTLGSYFALYEFDRVLDAERERVRTYFLRTRFRQTKDLTFELRVDFQDDALDDTLVLRLGTTWAF